MEPRGVPRDEGVPLILLVDDLPSNLQVLGKMLSQEHYQFALATNGQQALALIDKVLPDLILLDVMLPDVSGLDLCRQLKSSPRTRDIPIIFVTAKSETEDIIRGFEVGAVDYVPKPFQSAELVARVNTHISLKRTKDQRERLIAELRDALLRVKQLDGLLPICCYCKKIRDDEGYWRELTEYVQGHTTAEFTHGICQGCLERNFPDAAAEPGPAPARG